MTAAIDFADVPPVTLHELYMPLKRLIESGRGLALYNGLNEAALRELESEIWLHFSDKPHIRVAVALRFRALIQVFSSRRLREMFLQQGFKLIAKAVHEAAHQRLNTRFGFKPQAFVSSLSVHNVQPQRFQNPRAIELLAA